MYLGNTRIIINKINFESILSITNVKEMPNLHTHATHAHSVKFCSLRGEGRRGWEGIFMNGVRMKHTITLEYIEFSFC